MYAQLVERLDARHFSVPLGYIDLWAATHQALDEAHAEGRLKAEILETPDLYVELDPETVLALRDQKEAGKRLLLITNSEWSYTRDMMRYAFDRFLPDGTTWRDLFDLTIVSARKPDFFSGHGPLFEVVDEQGLLTPCPGAPTHPGVYLGGNAELVERYLGLSGSEIFYVGDHVYTDVRVSKDLRRWRACLIVRELEEELAAVTRTADLQDKLDALMAEKQLAEFYLSQLRLQLQRLEKRYAPVPDGQPPVVDGQVARARARIERLDDEIAPLATSLGALYNDAWGPLMSAGADVSFLAHQLEVSADTYTSRVSNFVYQTPFAYLRARRGRLPHDPE